MRIGQYSGIGYVVVCALAMLGGSRLVHANIYATLSDTPFSVDFNSNSNLSLSYRLNHAATAVTVEIYRNSDPSTVIKSFVGGITQGLNTVTWDGTTATGDPAPSATDYRFRVIASHDGYADWQQISSDGTATCQFSYPQGVSVNRNIHSTNFGHVYVCEGNGGQTSGRMTVGKGLFILNNDLTAATAQGNTARDGGVAWTSGFSFSPFKVTVAPDDDVFITDWSDDHAGVWIAPPDGSGTFSQLFNSIGDTPLSNHGSVASIYVEGTGENRILYTLDEDYHPEDGLGDILRYPIGTITSGYSDAPFFQTVDTSHILNARMDVVRDSDDSWWICQYRSTDANPDLPALSRWTPTESANSLLWGSGSTLLLHRAYGCLDIDTQNSRLVIGTRDRYGLYLIDIQDRLNPVLLKTISGTNMVQDVAFDAAGNVYAVDSSLERLRVYSPPDASNFTTPLAHNINIIARTDIAPPTIISAVSRKNHGTTPYDVDIKTVDAVEPRQGGPTQLLITFDEPINRIGNANDVTVSNATLDSITISENTLTVTLSGAVEPTSVTLAFGGIEDAANNIVTDTLCFGVLLGDANRQGGGGPDGAVNIFDIISIKNNMDRLVNETNFTNDIASVGNGPPDGLVNIYDIIAVKNNMDRVVSDPCP